jgi:uroporphyrinogen decarboxylase
MAVEPIVNHRENLMSLLRREGFSYIPPTFSLTPHLVDVYRERTGSSLPYEEYFDMPWRDIPDINPPDNSKTFLSWFPNPLKKGARIDSWGVAHEPGSADAMHMTRMIHPLRGVDDFEKIKSYPFPRFDKGDRSHQKSIVDDIHRKGFAAMGGMQCTIWETAWYIRSMEDLMMDMLGEEPAASFILDAVTEQAIIRAESYARAGADLIYLGDDIGMQSRIMMSRELYRTWLKPRLKKVIRAVKNINPKILILYHSCGYVLPFIEDLIEAGVDVLNPIQAESMDFREVVAAYGSRLSFHGCIGTQTVMPFGTPAEVKAAVRECLDSMGSKGGMLVSPTHVLEPEVPWENILAYVEACREYK